MEPVDYKKRITEIVLNHINKLDSSVRAKAKMAGIAHTAIAKMEAGTGMTLTTLEKIVNNFPELREPIGRVFFDYLSGNTEIKPTLVDKPDDNKEKASASKTEALGLLDKHPDYYLMPKIMLEKHRLISLEQIQNDKELTRDLVGKIEHLLRENTELKAKLPASQKAK